MAFVKSQGRPAFLTSDFVLALMDASAKDINAMTSGTLSDQAVAAIQSGIYIFGKPTECFIDTIQFGQFGIVTDNSGELGLPKTQVQFGNGFKISCVVANAQHINGNQYLTPFHYLYESQLDNEGLPSFNYICGRTLLLELSTELNTDVLDYMEFYNCKFSHPVMESAFSYQGNDFLKFSVQVSFSECIEKSQFRSKLPDVSKKAVSFVAYETVKAALLAAQGALFHR